LPERIVCESPHSETPKSIDANSLPIAVTDADMAAVERNASETNRGLRRAIACPYVMTTIAVVKKGNTVAIAADTLTKWGSGKESAAYIANSEKILKIGANYIAVTGNATFKLILRDYFIEQGNEIQLSSPMEIFRTWNRLHAVLKDKYFLMP
jgi:hypothetical protein